MRELYSMFECSTQIHAVHKMLSNLRDDSNEMKEIFGGPKTASVAGQPDPEWVRSSNVLRVYSMAFINHLLTSRHFVDQVNYKSYFMLSGNVTILKTNVIIHVHHLK
jgi:hypothetical protein